MPDIPRYDLHVSVFRCEGSAYLLRRTRNNRSDGSGIPDGKIVKTGNADLAKEIERLEKEEKRLEGELSRVNGMLHNERFMSKAPESKIAEERGKLEKYTQMMEQVKERLGQLRK